MGGSRKDRREQERLESKALRRALPLIKDNPVRAAVRTRYAVSLAGGSAPEAVLAGAHREADAFGAKIFAGSGAPACAPGCSHCCEHVNVGVNAVEARALASHLRQQPPAALEAVRQRISANATRAREASPGTYPRMPCALLGEDRRCTVYEHRPFVCRRAHSFDAEKCRRAAAGETLDLMVDARVIAAYSQIATAFREASAGFGGDAGSYELHQALDILLGHPTGDLSPAREQTDGRRIRAVEEALNAALRPKG